MFEGKEEMRELTYDEIIELIRLMEILNSKYPKIKN